jgi:hypothetical protein
LFLKCAHGARIIKRPNFHFAIFDLQYDSSQGAPARQVKLLQIENCKSQIANCRVAGEARVRSRLPGVT